MCSINLLKIGADIKYGPSFSLFSVTYQGKGKDNQGINDVNHANLSIPWHLPQQTPTVLSLLTWNCAISNFRGRETQLSSLGEWIEQENPVSVRLITGQGGSGKSRLGAEFASLLKIKEDWATGFIDLADDISYEVDSDKILFLIESPELHKKPLSKLLKHLAKLDQYHVDKPWKIRVLLLTRSTLSEWRNFLVEEEVFNIIDTRQIELKGIDDESAYELYNSASEKASELLDKVVPPLSKEAISEWISLSSENKIPMFIIGAAICDVLELKDQSVTYTSKEIVESIAEYELNRLIGIAKNNDIEDKYIFAKEVAYVNISGQKEIPVMERDYSDTVSANAEPIKPDIIATAFNQLILKKIPSADAESLVWKSVSSNLPDSLVTISRMIYEAENILNDNRYSAETVLEAAIKRNLGRCQLLFEHLNQDKSIYLCGITTEVCNTFLNNDLDLPTKASTLILLSNNLSQIGDHDRAIEVTKESIPIVEELYNSSPNKYSRLFVNTLSNLAGDCLENGLTDEALENLKRASKIYNKLIKTNSVRVIEYCIFLCNYGSYYLKVKEYNKALELHEKAVRMLESFADRSIGLFRKELAYALLNISVCYQKKLDFPKALSAAKKALEYYEFEASRNLVQFEPKVARSCLNIATSFPANSKDESIKHHIERAIEIYERYVEKSFASYADDLAKAYNILSKYLEKNQLFGDAIIIAEKEVEIYLLIEKKGIKKKDLTEKTFKAKTKLSHLLLQVDINRASEYIAESFETLTDCSGSEPNAIEPIYADLLLAKSRLKYLVGEIDDAIKITTESLDIFRNWAKKKPGKYEPEAARCLYVLGYLNITKQEREAALAHLTEGIETLKPHLKREPDLYEGYMNSLLMAKDHLDNLGKIEIKKEWSHHESG